jgi:hypothetical protein
LWDGLPSHRSTAMRDWIRSQRSWLVVERLPAYAPDLNPVEGLWSSLKAVELVNLTSSTLGEVIAKPTAASTASAAPGLRIPAPRRPVGLMTHQPDTQDL